MTRETDLAATLQARPYRMSAALAQRIVKAREERARGISYIPIPPRMHPAPELGRMMKDRICLGCGCRHPFYVDTGEPVGGALPCGH